MGPVRLALRLTSQSEWIQIFDPRDWTVSVPTDVAIETGAIVHIELEVDGWLATLRGTVVGHRDEPPAAVIALGGSERDKINHLNGFVRGGLLNLREKRRLPLRLQVTYGAVEGPASTFTKDINEEGLFLFTDAPLPETSQIHMLIAVPGQAQPVSVVGKVSHTILAQDDEPPGMGIVFELDAAGRAQFVALMADLEQRLAAGELPTNTLE